MQIGVQFPDAEVVLVIPVSARDGLDAAGTLVDWALNTGGSAEEMPYATTVARSLLDEPWPLNETSSCTDVTCAASWAAAEWTAAEAEAGAKVGFTSEQAWSWHGTPGVTAQVVLHWWTADLPDADASTRHWWCQGWAERGVFTSDLAAAGIGTVDFDFMQAARIEDPATVRWPLFEAKVCPDLAGVAHAQGRTWAQVRRFADLLRTNNDSSAHCQHLDRSRLLLRCGWSERASASAVEVLRSFRGFDLDDATACMATGMTAKGARQHLRAGRAMEPIRLLAALL